MPPAGRPAADLCSAEIVDALSLPGPSWGLGCHTPGMAAWIVWVLVAAGLAVGEVLTLAFLLGLIAPAALLAALVAAVGGGAAVQILAFILGSLAMLGLVRPIARRHLRTPARLRTGTAALVGQRGLVLERVDADGGRVRIGGEVWTAHAWDEGQVIEPGARVEVIEIKGATALVHEWEPQ